MTHVAEEWKSNCLIAWIPTVNHSMHACNPVPNPQGYCFLAISSFHSIITHLWPWCLSRYSLYPLSVGSRWAGHTGSYSTQRKHQRSRMKKWIQGVFLQNTPKPRCAAGQLWPPLLTAATAGHSSCWGWNYPQIPTFFPEPGMGTIKILFLERVSGAEY